MTFWEHLEELRSRLLIYLFFFILCFIPATYFSTFFISFLLKPTLKVIDIQQLVTLNLFDRVNIFFKMSFYISFIFSFPMLVFQLYKFIEPAYNSVSKKTLSLFFLFLSLLFFLGISIGYFFVLPKTLSLFINFAHLEGSTQLQLKNHLIFSIKILILSGLFHCVPLFMAIAAKISWISFELLKKYHSMIILGLCIFSAFITPSDFLSLLLVWIPLVFLFELGFLLVFFIDKKQ